VTLSLYYKNVKCQEIHLEACLQVSGSTGYRKEEKLKSLELFEKGKKSYEKRWGKYLTNDRC
jgi:hypothetical protein